MNKEVVDKEETSIRELNDHAMNKEEVNKDNQYMYKEIHTKVIQDNVVTDEQDSFTDSSLQEPNSIKTKNQRNLKFRKIIYFVFGLLEMLLLFRLVFKVLGANPQSTFVKGIYNITNVLLAPFIGIFKIIVTNRVETDSILEPTLLIAAVVYAVISMGLIKLISINYKYKNSEVL